MKKVEPEYPKVTARVVVKLTAEAFEKQLTLRQARLLVNRTLAQLNRAGAFKK